jgi:hypothetical protein
MNVATTTTTTKAHLGGSTWRRILQSGSSIEGWIHVLHHRIGFGSPERVVSAAGFELEPLSRRLSREAKS